jgi:hypothetical protein
MTYTANDFVSWYQDLTVEVGDGKTVSVCLNKYMIGYDNTSVTAQARQKVQMLAKQKKLDPNGNAFSRANGGKVSPSDCEHILNLAIQTGVCKAKDVQKWADTHLGVDCTGFTVAYFGFMERIALDKYNGGASCFTLINQAKKNHRPSDGGPLVWDLGEVEADDMIIWMNEHQVETRAPGHIAVVYAVDTDKRIIRAGESNGADDGQGHYGPKLTERTWEGVKGGGKAGSRYVQLGKSNNVVFVRPPPTFG